MTLGNIQESIIRPKYMGSTISSGNTTVDKQLQAMQEAIIGLNINNMQKYPVNKLQGMTIRKLQGG